MSNSSNGAKNSSHILEHFLQARLSTVNYLTHIDDKRRLVYVETPKVACTSIKKFMMDQYVGGVFDLQNINDVHQREISPLKQLNTLAPGTAKEVWSKKYRRFTFVRNPFSRLLSGYLDKLVNNEFERQRHLPMMGFAPDSKPTLVEFLERLVEKSDTERDIHFTTQSALLMVDAVEYDYIGRFETFEEDFLRLQATFYGIDHPSETYEVFGKHHASNANEKILQYYGAKEIELVREIYRTDFQLFGYSENITQASHREPPVQVEQLFQSARLLALVLDRNPVGLAAKIARLFMMFEEAKKTLDLKKGLPVGLVSTAFQKLTEHGEVEAILNLNDDFPDCVLSVPVAGNQVVKAMTARGEHDKAAAYLATLRQAHPQALMAWILSAENGYHRGAPDEAAGYFEHISSLEILPPWAFQLYLALYMKYSRHAPEKGARLAEKVFLDEDFLHVERREWFAAEFFMRNLFRNKPVDSKILLEIRRALETSATERNLLSAYMLEGEWLSFLPEKLPQLAAMLGKLGRDDFVSILGLRFHPLNKINLVSDERDLLFQVAKIQEANGRQQLASMLRVMLNGNVFHQMNALAEKRLPPRDRPLRVALCISGQLRGFDQCFPEWRNSDLFEVAEVSVFVSTWELIGRKFPTSEHAHRTFQGAFLKAFCRCSDCDPKFFTRLDREYPTFSQLLSTSDKVNAAEVSKFFGAAEVSIHNENLPEFARLTNQEKMLFQIESAFRLAENSGINFDVVVRNRPDVTFFTPVQSTWENVLRMASESCVLLADDMFRIVPPMGLFVGDLSAVGRYDVMRVYSTTYSNLSKLPDEAFGPDFKPKPHSALAWNLAAQGVSIERLAIKGRRLVDPEPLLSQTIAEALSRDVPPERRKSDPLWLAIQQDLQRGRT